MNLCEHDAKRLLAAHGLPMPEGRLASDAEAPDRPSVAKAQLFGGGRGKAGLVRKVAPGDTDALRAIAETMQERGLPPAIRLEWPVDIAAELYLAVAIDDLAGAPVLLFSPEGGIEVEHGAPVRRLLLPADGGAVHAHSLVPFLREAGAPARALGRIARFAAELVRVMRAEDATLVEINPLAVTPDDRILALDAKITLDDGALRRHPSRDVSLSQTLEKAGMSAREPAARAADCSLVEMDGTVVMVTAGAGLGMLCADLLKDAAFPAATFFDNAPGARVDTTEARLDLAFERAGSPDIAAIFFYQALATRDLAPRVEALAARLASPPAKPVYVGITASFLAERTMTAREGLSRLAALGARTAEFPEDLVALMVEDRERGLLPRPAA